MRHERKRTDRWLRRFLLLLPNMSDMPPSMPFALALHLPCLPACLHTTCTQVGFCLCTACPCLPACFLPACPAYLLPHLPQLPATCCLPAFPLPAFLPTWPCLPFPAPACPSHLPTTNFAALNAARHAHHQHASGCCANRTQDFHHTCHHPALTQLLFYRFHLDAV